MCAIDHAPDSSCRLGGPGPSEPRLTDIEERSFHPDYLATHDVDDAIGLLRFLPSTSSDLMVVYDDHAKLIYASPAMERILGFHSVLEVDQNILEMVHPEDRDRCAENLFHALGTPGVNPPAVYRVRTASSGAWRSLEVIATNCLADPRIDGVVLNLRDVTRTVELRRAYATFGHANQMLLHATSEQELFEWTCKTIIDVGGYAEAWIGIAREDAERSVAVVASAGRIMHLERAMISWADDQRGQGPVGRAVRSNEPNYVRDLASIGVEPESQQLIEEAGLGACCTLPIDCGDGVRRVLVIADSEVRDFEDEEMQLFGALAENLAFGLRDLRAQVELARLALIDPLTGLPNRTQFMLELGKRMKRVRQAGGGLAILFLDLDHLKLINDSLGHDAGDVVIAEAARRFDAVLRKRELAARFGGDEFMFMVDGDPKSGAAVAVAERLLSTLATPFEVRGVQLSVSCSIGVAIARRGDAAENLVRDADTAMYRAKEAGRNRISIFDDELRERTVARLKIESDLARALHRDELHLHFQPIVDPVSGRPVGAEALLRWRHPDRGNVPPLEFIHVAEDLGLITDIGAWVFEESAMQLALWDHDVTFANLSFVSVNVSSRQLEFGDPDRWIKPALERAGVDPSRIEVEVTESVAMGDLAASQEALWALRRLGLTIAIDDFGTGYSSLSYLHALPITTVKIDRSFIERLTSENGSTPIVRAILEMSHAMGLRVIAEGVSSAQIGLRVAALGCDLAQGFHFARPMAPGSFGPWCRGVADAAIDAPADHAGGIYAAEIGAFPG